MMNFIKKLFGPKSNLNKLVKEGALIIDVRTKGEYEAGHIPGSKNIPLDMIKKGIDRLQVLNRPFITVCRSGNRSELATSILSAAGVEVYNGGAWTNLNKQLK